MDTMILYCASPHYPHPFTGTGTVVARHKGEQLPPRTSTTMPDYKSGFWPCFSPDGWRMVEDHRGSVGWVDGKETLIAELGPLPDGWNWNAPDEAQAYHLFDRMERDVAEAV